MASSAARADIRAALPADRESIIDLARSSGLFEPDGIADTAATLAAFLAGRTDGDEWLVGTVGDRVAAIAYYAPERMTDGTWNLYLLAVHPEHQGHGLGAALVRQTEEFYAAGDDKIVYWKLLETAARAED